MADTEVIRGGFVICRPQPIPYEDFHTSLGITLMSDLHIGAVNVDYDLIKQELETAKSKNDRILINGDIFDMILLGDRKRYRQDTLHPRLQGRKDVIQEAIKWGVELLKPVVHQIDVIGEGNHEASVAAYHSFDPIQALLYELESSAKGGLKHTLHHGGFTGFVDYRFHLKTKKQQQKVGSNSKRLVIYYHHGSGGAAPVTKGAIDFQRRDTFIDADIIHLGHKHWRNTNHVRRMSCPESGLQPRIRECRHVMTGSYMDTYVGQSQESIRKDGRRSSWAADQGFAPQGKGGARIEVIPNSNSGWLDLKIIQ